MNKGRRNELTLLHYKKRLRRFANSYGNYQYVGRNLKKNHPKTCELFDAREQLVYKTASTPCSCYMCSGYWKYRRCEKKREDVRLINEGFTTANLYKK